VPTTIDSLIAGIVTYTDGFGAWRAHITFTRPLFTTGAMPAFTLATHWPRIRTAARDAIVAELTVREQKTWETRETAEHRVRASMPALVIIDRDVEAGCWRGVTLGEA
jgi:hypothetical protein